MMKNTLQVGDKVILNEKCRPVAEENKGKIFTVCSEPYQINGTECVLLVGGKGGYAVNGLIKLQEDGESIWIIKIKEILAQYKTKAEFDIFKAARGALQYEDRKGVPVPALTDIAEIVAYCEREICERVGKRSSGVAK